MEQRKVGKLAQFHPGAKLGLTAEQAKTRAHNLKDLGDGVYEVLRSVQFKAGEVIGVESLNRAQEALFAPSPAEVEQSAPRTEAPKRGRRRG